MGSPGGWAQMVRPLREWVARLEAVLVAKAADPEAGDLAAAVSAVGVVAAASAAASAAVAIECAATGADGVRSFLEMGPIARAIKFTACCRSRLAIPWRMRGPSP